MGGGEEGGDVLKSQAAKSLIRKNCVTFIRIIMDHNETRQRRYILLLFYIKY